MSIVVGKVIGKSTPYEFNFVTSEYFEGEYIEVKIDLKNGENGKFIGQIVNIEAINPYFENPSLVNYVNNRDENMASHTLYMAKVKIITALINDKKRKYNSPPAPGLNVFLANENHIKIALGLKEEGINIGTLKHDNKIEIVISPVDLFRTHLTVLGRTGSGKSYFLKKIIKEINKDRSIVIFSPTAEYNEYSNNIQAKVISKKNLSIPINIRNISEIYDLTFQEQNILENFLQFWREKVGWEIYTVSNEGLVNELKKWMKYWIRQDKQQKLDFGEGDRIFKNVKKAEKIPKNYDSLIRKLTSINLFLSDKTFQMDSSSVIFDMSDLSQTAQEIYIKYTLSKIISKYRKNVDNKPLKPLLIIIEEAHNFAPSVQSTYCKPKIVQIAREGRKLGLSLCIVSQRPRHIDQTILAQCGTLFIFHLPHPEDIKHVFSFSPVYSLELMEEIRKLSTGEYMILSDIIGHPVRCDKNMG